MEKKSEKSNLIFLVIALLMCLFFSFLVWTAAKEDVIYTYYNPILTDSPIYEELAEGDTTTVYLSSDTDKYLSGITVLPVNVSRTGTGSLNIRVESSDDTILFTKLDEKDIKVGEWNRVPVTVSLKKDRPVKVAITAVGCNPYFMYAPATDYANSSISVGIYTNEINRKMLIVMAIKYAILIFAFSTIVANKLSRSTRLFNRCGNDIFLALVYIFVCVGIYSASYKNGIFITADSAGYLREAVSMRAGYGFGYDALAGYRSWFANWPILYPSMIFVVMCISGLDSYLSSKIVTAILVLIILVVLRIRFKKNAWIYSVALLNLGFVKLTYYTWSEIPFILFLMLFAFKLGDIVNESSDRKPKISDYVLLGLYGLLSFLTRYFGIYVWVVVGGYIVMYLVKRIRTKEKGYFVKASKLTVTALISGLLSCGYLFLNKIMNGMPSGVSRSTWWDDYRALTVDLFNSLILEIFNVFHIDCERIIGNFNFVVKIVFVAIIVGALTFFLIRELKSRGGIYSPSGALIVLGGSYYAIFTVIRYFSSMDTFYFRFFEPASYLLTIGIIMLIITKVDTTGRLIKYMGIVLAALVMWGILVDGTDGLCFTSQNYYEVAQKEWDKAYAEIPYKSVVIFSDIDYRSEYYRPDVVSGEISSADTWDTVKARFYGSDNLIVQREYAESMVECGEYDNSVSAMLEESLMDESDSKYICIKLGNNG